MADQGKQLPDYVVKQIRRLYRQGFSVPRIAYITGCHHKTCYKYLELSQSSASNESDASSDKCSLSD